MKKKPIIILRFLLVSLPFFVSELMATRKQLARKKGDNSFSHRDKHPRTFLHQEEWDASLFLQRLLIQKRQWDTFRIEGRDKWYRFKSPHKDFEMTKRLKEQECIIEFLYKGFVAYRGSVDMENGTWKNSSEAKFPYDASKDLLDECLHLYMDHPIQEPAAVLNGVSAHHVPLLHTKEAKALNDFLHAYSTLHKQLPELTVMEQCEVEEHTRKVDVFIQHYFSLDQKTSQTEADFIQTIELNTAYAKKHLDSLTQRKKTRYEQARAAATPQNFST